MKLSFPFPLAIALNQNTGASFSRRAAGFKSSFVNGVAWHSLTFAGRLNRKLERFRIDWTTAENPKPQNRSGPARRPSDSPEAGKFTGRSSAKNASRGDREERCRFLQVQKFRFRRGVHSFPLPAGSAVAE